MSNASTRVLIAGLCFLVVFILGFWLRGSGRPYNGLLLTIHKLVAVGVLVFLIVMISQLNRVSRLSGLELTVALVALLLFLGTIATGALLTADKPMPAIVSTMHLITPFLTVLSTAGTLYMLLSRR